MAKNTRGNAAPTRRRVLRGSVGLIGPLVAAQSRPAVYAYVGCYTTPERNGRGDGIHVYRMDQTTGAWSHIQHVGSLVNPSFLITSKDQRFLYSVHGDEQYATSFAIEPATGHLKLLNQARTGGSNGVAHAIDPTGKFMVVANYGTGTVAVLPIRADGALADYTQLVKLEGEPGPHRKEQTSSHPHHVIFDPSGRYVIVPDKGLDRVFVFRLENGKLSPTEQGSVRARPGYAPRHAGFHPTLPAAWVVNEISSMVTTYRWDAERGSLQPVQILPSLPADFTGNNSLAEIAVSANGRFVYCSNRGHNSIAVFQTDAKTGLLTSSGWVPTRGKTPRFIGLDLSHRFLFATNEQSDNVTSWRVDAELGRLMPTAQVVQNASPVTIAFAR